MAQGNKNQPAKLEPNSIADTGGAVAQESTRKLERRQANGPGSPAVDMDAGVDVFLLERLFPDAHDVFQASSNPDPNHDCIVVLDTNTLLLPYSVSKDNLTNLRDCYLKIAKDGRLFLPERVAREFIKNRDRKLAEMAQVIDDLRSRINIGEARISPLLDGLAENQSLATASEALVKAKKEYVSALNGLTSQIRSWRGNDPVTSLYRDLFTKERFSRPADANDKLEAEWTYRLRNKIPPGYKDVGKDDSGIGDFIIWSSLLSLGAAHKRDLIFVTGEEKADWFFRAGNAGVYPRPELIDEYRRRSGGRTLRLSSLHELLREMSAPEKLVKDVEEAEFTANTAIQASTSVNVEGAVSSARRSPQPTTISFDYSTHNGKLQIESVGKVFDLAFFKASDRRIHLSRHGTTRRIARIKQTAIDLPTSIDQQETSSRSYTIQLGEGFLIENDAGDVLAGRIIGIQDDSRGADRDEVRFTYLISPPGADVFVP